MTESTGLRAPHLLLVESPYYAHIAAMLREGAERAVAAAGGQVLKATHAIGPHGYRAIVLDSEGNRVALHSATR